MNKGKIDNSEPSAPSSIFYTFSLLSSLLSFVLYVEFLYKTFVFMTMYSRQIPQIRYNQKMKNMEESSFVRLICSMASYSCLIASIIGTPRLSLFPSSYLQFFI